VDGLVCSFCAYGTEKNLSKVGFIDKSYFGGDGVLVEVEKGYVQVSIKDSKSIDLKSLIKAITKGGYVAKEASFWVSGIVGKTKDGYTLEKTDLPYSFSLIDFDQKNILAKQVIILARYKIGKKFPKGNISVSVEKFDLIKK